MPAELERAEGRRQRIRELRQKLEAEAKAQAKEKARNDDSGDEPPGSASLPSHRIPANSSGTPDPKAQRNFTDEDSRIMKAGDGFIQGYNCQAAVDEAHQIIVAQAVTNQPPDVEHFVPMMEQVGSNCGRMPQSSSADAGYFSEANAEWALNQGIDIHIATGRRKHDEPSPTVRGRAPNDMTLKEIMARKLATKTGAKVYSRRKVIAEPPFGQIKSARGFRQFLLRGLVKVRGEWSLMTLTHNLLKLHSVHPRLALT